jgi:hypothetical protein
MVATPSATAEPTLAVDRFAEVVTTDLVVRSAPGTDQGSAVYGTIANVLVYVLDGPVQADGHEWWLVAPIHHFDQFEPPPAGWVAVGEPDEIWLAPTHPSCQKHPTSDALWATPAITRVGCYAGVELTLRGVLDGCATVAGMAWGHRCILRNCPGTPADCEAVTDDPRVIVHFDSLPAQFEGRIVLTGHFDDAVAEGCGVSGDPLSRLRILGCRVHFVVTSYRFQGGATAASARTASLLQRGDHDIGLAMARYQVTPLIR